MNNLIVRIRVIILTIRFYFKKRKLSNEKENEFINLFSSYEGIVTTFYEEKNISKT